MEYVWSTALANESASYLTPTVVRLCREVGAKRILDVGCGNGALCAELTAAGFHAEGCDDSVSGIRIARTAHPAIRFHEAGVTDSTALSGFDTVVSTEVIEHLYDPRALPQFARKVGAKNLIITTPYHGYLKNLALSVAGAWDKHHHPMQYGGHIKFWSRATLTALLAEEGFTVAHFEGAGRLPYLWKSMVVVAH